MAPVPPSRYPSDARRLLGFTRAGLCCALLLASTAAWAGELRVWTSSDGKTVNAELVSATDTTVTIKNEMGREFTFPHERLSQADRDVIQAHLAKKKAEYDELVWPKPNGEETIKAPLLKRLHTADAKKFTSTYTGRMLLIEGHVLDVKEDRMSASQGMIVVLDTEDKIAIEMKFNKASYDKDLTFLLAPGYYRSRGVYDQDAFRVSVADKSIVVERRYVISRDYDYSYSIGSGDRYRNKWSDWEIVAKPVARGETVKIRGEFVSVFNSVMSFTDARLVESSQTMRTVVRY